MRLLLAALLLAPAPAMACEPDYPGRVRQDRPIAVASDGSFRDASDDDGWTDISGRAVRDIGGGRVGQVIETWSCETFQRLLVVDCASGEAILVDGLAGVAVPEDGFGVQASTRALQPPYGPLALGPSVTVPQIAALAAREGWSARTDVAAAARELGSRNAWDPFLGCRLFYPGSPGAGG